MRTLVSVWVILNPMLLPGTWPTIPSTTGGLFHSGPGPLKVRSADVGRDIGARGPLRPRVYQVISIVGVPEAVFDIFPLMIITISLTNCFFYAVARQDLKGLVNKNREHLFLTDKFPFPPPF